MRSWDILYMYLKTNTDIYEKVSLMNNGLYLQFLFPVSNATNKASNYIMVNNRNEYTLHESRLILWRRYMKTAVNNEGICSDVGRYLIKLYTII
jgi:hypothetical protein